MIDVIKGRVVDACDGFLDVQLLFCCYDSHIKEDKSDFFLREDKTQNSILYMCLHH